MPSLQERGISPGSPERRLTIEQRGIDWGERVQERMRHRKEPVVAIVRLTEEYDRLRKLPRLVYGARSSTDVRIDELGKLFYTTWREKRVMTDEGGKRRLKPPQRGQLPEYEILLPRRRVTHQDI